MPAFSPDNRFLYFMSDRYGSFDIFKRATDGPSVQQITDLSGAESHVAVSPNGEWLAYYRILGEERDIFVIPAEGGVPERITEHPAPDFQPTWSPDGSQLAFVSERTDLGQIWVVPIDGGRRAGEARQLSREPMHCLAPWWLPDARGIAFVGYHGDGSDVYLLPVEGGVPAKRLTQNAQASRIRWDPLREGLLVLAGWGENRHTIRHLALDGTVADSLLVQVSEPTVFDVSRDGRKIAYSRIPDIGDIWIAEALNGTY
jgi:TolB protein